MTKEETAFYLENDTLKSLVLNDIFRGLGEKEICSRHSITPEIFLKVKNVILKELKEKSDKAEITSHALRYFKNLIKERKYFSKAVEYNLNRTMTEVLYKVVRGQLRPTYGIIFMLRKYIAPCMWYYKETEELPEPVKFESHYEDSFDEYNTESKNILAQRKTIGHTYFDILKENRVMARFCALHNVTLTEAANYVTMRHKKDGTYRYTTRPTIDFISNFKEELHPDLWYIFPDEVTPQELERIKTEAYARAGTL